MEFTQIADDTNTLMDNYDIFVLRSLANQELSKVSPWLAANRNKANNSKTYFMIFKGNKKLTSLQLSFKVKPSPKRALIRCSVFTLMRGSTGTNI